MEGSVRSLSALDIHLGIAVIGYVLSECIEILGDCIVVESIFEEIVGLSLLHVPGRYLESKLLEFETVHDLRVKLVEDVGQLRITGIALLELPIRHLDADFLASDLGTCLIENIKHLHKVLNPALAQVVGMQPNRAKLLTRQRRKDRLIDAFN